MKRTRATKRRQRGMTLIEIMVVIAILGTLMGLVGLSVVNHASCARRKVAHMDLQNLDQALQMYQARFARPFDAARGLSVLVEKHILKKMPKTPWETDYGVRMEADGPVVFTLGKDDAPGGEDEASDMSSRDPPPAC